MAVKLETKKYSIPGWVDEFIETKYLKDLEKLDPAEATKRLYNVGRASLEQLQPLVEATVPEQLEDGRYTKDVPSDYKGGDALMFHQRSVEKIVHECLENITRRRPKRPFTFVPVWTPQEIEQRTRARKWNSMAWGAGSHAGADIDVLYMNVQMGLEEYRPAYEAAMATVTALQNAEDGMWGGQQNEPFDRVNGTMKLLSKVHFIQECHLPFADKVIDYVLDYSKNAYPTMISAHHRTIDLCCSMIDIMFCLEYAIRMTDHQRDDIAETVYGLFPIMEQLGKREDCSLNLWGSIRRAANLCGFKDELGWPDKVYRFPDA